MSDDKLKAQLAAVTAERDRLRELVDRAIRGLKCIGDFHYRPGDDPHALDSCLWGRVAQVFGTGSTRAAALCREFGQDPDYAEPRHDTDDEDEQVEDDE